MCVCVYSAGQTPRKVRQHYTGELMDVYCSQCSKKVNLLNDLEARLKNLKANRYKHTTQCYTRSTPTKHQVLVQLQ